MLELISRSRYTVAVGHNIITKEELTERDSVLVYIPIIYYRAHIYGCWSLTYLQQLRSYQDVYRTVTVQLRSTAPLGNQAASTVSQCPNSVTLY